MDIRIDEIQRIASPGDSPGYLRVYARVTATEGAKSVTEEFHIGRQVVGRRVVTNAQGFSKTTAGVFIDTTTLDPSQPEPQWEYEVAILDLRAEVLAVLRQTIRSRLDTNWPGDQVRMRDTLRLGDRITLPLPVRQLQGQVVN
mgnify:CR=1 FL=1